MDPHGWPLARGAVQRPGPSVAGALKPRVRGVGGRPAAAPLVAAPVAGHHAMILVLVLLLPLACDRGRRGQADAALPAASAEEAHARLRQNAAGGPGALFALLDQESRWSVMSIHRDMREACRLVRAHYPRQRQARELARCQAATRAPDARALLGDLDLPAVGRPGELRGLEPRGEGRVAARGGGPELLFCRERGGAWAFCGLRAALRRLKVKAARDLATIQEDITGYGE